MAGMVKNFLYAFCGKKKTQPVYSERPGKPGKFSFQVQVNGFDYIGFGTSTSKKEAEANAAKDFVGFLIGAGFIPADSVPDEILAEQEGSAPVPTPQPLPSNMAPAPQALTMAQGQQPSTQNFSQMSQSLMQQVPSGGSFSGHTGGGAGSRDYHYSMYNKRSFAEAEDLDLDAHLHGNWTLVNAKSRLHQYLQQNRQPAEFKYSTVGPDHNRSFKADLPVFIKSHRKTIRGTGNASTKKQAAQSCSLSLVRQLFHIGAIEAAEPGQVQAKRQKTDDIEPFDVGINPDLEQQLQRLLNDLGIQPVTQVQLMRRLMFELSLNGVVDSFFDGVVMMKMAWVTLLNFGSKTVGTILIYYNTLRKRMGHAIS